MPTKRKPVEFEPATHWEPKPKTESKDDLFEDREQAERFNPRPPVDTPLIDVLRRKGKRSFEANNLRNENRRAIRENKLDS